MWDIFVAFNEAQSLFVLSGGEEGYFLVQSRRASPDSERVAGTFTGAQEVWEPRAAWLESSDVG